MSRQPERLKQTAHTMAQVTVQQHHGDDVENGCRSPGEAIDHHFVNIVNGFAMKLSFVHFAVVIIAHTNGKMKQMIDNESHDGQAAPDHGAR